MLSDLTIANIVWLVLAALSFVLGQIYLFHCIGKLEKLGKYTPQPAFLYL